MTSFVAFPDIHDRSEPLKAIRHVLADVDVILLPGDMSNGRMDNLQRTLNIIEIYNENILAVCGNMDTVQMNMQLAREGLSIHRRHQMVDGIAILGCGGALPYVGDYVFSEEELAQFLEDALMGIPPDTPKILLAHQPPYGTKVDQLSSGEHVGSHAVRAFIEQAQPLICFCGHIHEAVGSDKIGETLLINPGPIGRTNQYAYAEIEKGQVLTLEIRPVEALGI